MTETAGIPIGVVIDGANRNDCKLTEATILSITISRPTPTSQEPQGVCLDKAYDHQFVRDILENLASRRISAAVERKPKTSAMTLTGAPDDGSWSGSIPGSTATGRCSSAGQRNPRSTQRC